jgi:hypothetical protein
MVRIAITLSQSALDGTRTLNGQPKIVKTSNVVAPFKSGDCTTVVEVGVEPPLTMPGISVPGPLEIRTQ